MTKQAKIIIGSLLGLLLIGIIIIVATNTDEQVNVSSFENSFENESFTYEDLMKSENDEMFATETAVSSTEVNTSPATNDTLNVLSTIQAHNDLYANEYEASTLAIQEAIAELTARENQLNIQHTNHKTVQTETKIDKVTEEEKRLAYIKQLREAREAYNTKLKRDASTNLKQTANSSFTAVIYGDQHLLPGDRLEMALPKDTRINGKVYAKGTPIFAYISIERSRVLLDINNIDGDKIALTSEDAWDHRKGIYSKRAGELWRIYENNQKDKALQEAKNELAIDQKTRLIGSAVQDLASFFRQKKLRKEQKILLINNHEVILKLKSTKINL